MMFFSENKDMNSQEDIKKYFKSSTFQRLLIGIITLMISFAIIVNGAAPKKYKLNLGDKSLYDITAPREIINKIKSEENAKAAYNSVSPAMKEISTATIEVLNKVDDFITLIESSRKSVEKSLQSQGITKKDRNYKNRLEVEQQIAEGKLEGDVKNLGITLSKEQVAYLVITATEEDIVTFKKVIKEIFSTVMADNITQEILPNKIFEVQNACQNSQLNQGLKNIGALMGKGILKPNRTIDEELTKTKKEEAAKKTEHIVKLSKGERIISVGDIVSEDKFELLNELNLLETTGRFDFNFAGGILSILVLLAVLLVTYMHNFNNQILNDRNDVLVLCLIILLSLLIARWVYEYSPLAIPIFIAPMLISILLDLKLAVVVNFILAIAISFITKGDTSFLYLSMIGGTFSAFLVSKANQRSKLSMAGVIIAVINVLILSCIGFINRSAPGTIVNESIIVFTNGIISIILTIGMLPFWEATFNIVTPLKLLELANPNQPLIKRLLMEAPGTYHHSLMVGNLAEVATEAIGGNSLLARIGAYFHDVGKLKRPNFFKENQLSDNPHDRMTANLSTLVITSHTQDGLELATKYKIPLPIKDIIRQHHGTTLVAYFYHKAKKGEKGETVKPENFRYEGPRPATKEAAVVMLADSVEAAVRSMVDKTEGKIEGLVRKIIKDKLDDGQLDMCDLTLKDLDIIAKSFMRVLSGFFHEREEYPEVKVKSNENHETKQLEQSEKRPQEEGVIENDNSDRERTE